MPTPLDKRFILLDPTRSNSINAGNIYYDTSYTIKDKIDGISSILPLFLRYIPVSDFHIDSDYRGCEPFVFNGIPSIGFTSLSNGKVYSIIGGFNTDINYNIRAIYGLEGVSSTDTNIVLRVVVEGIFPGTNSFTLVSDKIYNVLASPGNVGKLLRMDFTDSLITSGYTSECLLFRISVMRNASNSQDTYDGVFNLIGLVLNPINL